MSAGEAEALFLQIVSGMKELVHLVWEAKPASQCLLLAV